MTMVEFEVRGNRVGVTRELCLPRLLFGTIRPVLTPVVSLSLIIVYTRVGTSAVRCAGLGKCALNLYAPLPSKSSSSFTPPASYPESRSCHSCTLDTPSSIRRLDRAYNNITKADCKILHVPYISIQNLCYNVY